MKRILIVEDEAGMASFLDKGLASRGYSTKVGADGAGGDRDRPDEDFDLVILDLGLPDHDGLSVLREIRRRGERMPVIILTARDDLNDKVEGLDAAPTTTSPSRSSSTSSSPGCASSYATRGPPNRRCSKRRGHPRPAHAEGDGAGDPVS